MTARALCAGKWWLFDSTDPIDHDQAAKLCRDCPLLAECHQRATDLYRAHYTHSYRPLAGTWAGKLYGADTRNPKRYEREEALFSDEEARECHRQWANGERDNDRVRLGERVYQRRIKRARDKTRRAVA